MYGYGAGHTPEIGQTCDACAWSNGRKSAHLGGVLQRLRVRHVAIGGIAILRSLPRMTVAIRADQRGNTCYGGIGGRIDGAG
jgi:hypothetical protein